MLRPKNCKKCGGKMKQAGGQVMPKQQDYPDYESWQAAMDSWLANQATQQSTPNLDLSMFMPKQLTEQDIIPGVNAPYSMQTTANIPQYNDRIQEGITKGIIGAPKDWEGTPMDWYAFMQQPQKKNNKVPQNTLQNIGIAMKGIRTGLGEIAGRVDRGRQNQYDYLQQTALGMMNPMPATDYQPNPYSLYAKYGGSLKKYQKGGAPKGATLTGENYDYWKYNPMVTYPGDTLTNNQIPNAATRKLVSSTGKDNVIVTKTVNSDGSPFSLFDTRYMYKLADKDIEKVDSYISGLSWLDKLTASLRNISKSELPPPTADVLPVKIIPPTYMDNTRTKSPINGRLKYGGLQHVNYFGPPFSNGAKMSFTNGQKVDERAVRRVLNSMLRGFAKMGGEMKKGGIHIKPENKGKFTDYCGGKVTNECIQKGLDSPSTTIRKRANFARNARKWN